MARLARRFFGFALALGLLLGVSVAGGGFYVQRQLQNSLPQTTGSVTLDGLDAEVAVDRDSLGIPTITAASRADAARALGFVHAQDRFFQMDLQRRQPAGELSALVGARARQADRNARVHRFRHISRMALERATPEYRRILEAYTDGVNAGLAGLAAAPIEYHVLRTTPDPWTPEDSILTLVAMFNTLQGRQAGFEGALGTLHDTLPPEMYTFLAGNGSEWDAPVTGGRFVRPPIPSAETFNLRRQLRVGAGDDGRARPRESASNRPHTNPRLDASCVVWEVCLSEEEAAGIGSNNWAVAGSHTENGAALVANDMHLGISVPNIWYRAVLHVPDPVKKLDPAPFQKLHSTPSSVRLAGVTLPGLPSLVVGSNGHVAWGFTNSGGDWSDLIIVEPDPARPDHYLTPSGAKPMQVFEEVIEVAGGVTGQLTVRWTEWGPVIGRDHRGREIVQRWVAHDPAVLAADATAPERTRTLDEAMTMAAGLGIPAQNFVAADASGRIGWTIAGPIPRRVGFDGMRPTSWADGSRRWNGYLTPAEYPRVVDPNSGRLWTANAPVVEGAMLATIGEGGYADGIRARIIRDRLLAIDRATPEDMLDVQLDDDALFHERWRTLLLELLTPEATRLHPRRAEFRELIENTWTGRAEPGSVAYRLVRSYRLELSREVSGMINDYVRLQDREFDFARANRSEGPLWQFVTERPLHLLHPRHESWEALMLSAVDWTVAELTADGTALSDQTWGAFNRAVVRHPLGTAIPLVGRWVNMPPDPLPGDIFTPRAHSPRAGPSERMIVSPGREEEGILHMPTGQSGHPLSPHYSDQHRSWVEGTPLPFLPGPSIARLTLVPASAAR